MPHYVTPHPVTLQRKGRTSFALFVVLAERTGLEPATPGVTGRYSNQLNYRSRAFSYPRDERHPTVLIHLILHFKRPFDLADVNR
jgi:hypothetical protein